MPTKMKKADIKIGNRYLYEHRDGRITSIYLRGIVDDKLVIRWCNKELSGQRVWVYEFRSENWFHLMYSRGRLIHNGIGIDFDEDYES